tara:strand:- start:437 stop:1204 length:768 start_codon:yes stop_codon:yes gene_type:complete
MTSQEDMQPELPIEPEAKPRRTVASMDIENGKLLAQLALAESRAEQALAVRPAAEPQAQEKSASIGELLWKRAGAISRATVIPKAYQGQQANVFVALEVAERMQIGTFEVMQNLNVIHGNPTWSSSYAIGLANQRGPFKGPIQFDVDEKEMSVTAWAMLKEEHGGTRVEYTVSMAMATKAGWTSNALYKSMPLHMCRFRSAVLLIRTTCPEVLFGMQTSEEVNDVRFAKARPADLDALNEAFSIGPAPADPDEGA